MHQEVFNLSRVLFVPIWKVAGSRCHSCTVNTLTSIDNILQMKSPSWKFANLLISGLRSLIDLEETYYFWTIREHQYINTSDYLCHLKFAYSNAIVISDRDALWIFNVAFIVPPNKLRFTRVLQVCASHMKTGFVPFWKLVGLLADARTISSVDTHALAPNSRQKCHVVAQHARASPSIIAYCYVPQRTFWLKRTRLLFRNLFYSLQTHLKFLNLICFTTARFQITDSDAHPKHKCPAYLK